MDDCNKGAAAAQLTVVSTLCVCVFSLIHTNTDLRERIPDVGK